MSRLADRYPTAFVTGAAEGIGREVAEMLAGEGVRVWATSRRADRLAAVVAAGAGRIQPLALDLSDPAGAERVLAGAREAAGGDLALLVNNGGYGLFGDFAAVPGSDWEAQWQAMLGGTARVTQAAWRRWLERPGQPAALVNVSSLAAEFPIPYMSGYNVAKAGLSALSESLMAEARGTAIAVIDFRPGDYRTGFNTAMAGRAGETTGWSAAARGVRGTLDRMLAAAPDPARAAADLRRALRRGRSGTVRSGSWVQASLAPLAARVLPDRARRAIVARYFRLPGVRRV